MIPVGGIFSGALGALRFALDFRARAKRRGCLERLLAEKDQPGDDTLTVQQLMGETGFSDQQVTDALQGSKVVKPTSGHLGNQRAYRFIR